ncbi:YncE family protein (plasmid) [Hymenobacter sp. NBH84]|uniref:YncE family protein n=1 Tax=Hymenobacter sp. NBH84 TaxID=2596915 RepID=UPI0016290EB3|nr:YncE family protein [Hymenobacter sp. NBH84]QNE42214.1 YncE family protein [Hymenobacter sp. NBH84]
MKNLLAAVSLTCWASFGLLPVARAQSTTAPYRVLSTIPIRGDGGWDFLTTDPAGERLYVAHGTQTEVIDLKTKRLLGTIPNTPGVHGVAVVPSANRGYVSCGRNNTCIVFDLKTLRNLGTISTGPKPDAMLYDAYSKRVFAFSNDGGQSTVINATTGKVVGTAELGGDAEVPATDGKGHLFVNLEDKSEVVEVDTRSLAVLHRYSLASGNAPTGLAFDAHANRLFSGCANEQLVVTDSKTGKQMAVLPIGKGVDGVAFDPTSGNVLSFNGGDGTITVIHQDSPTAYRVVATVPTAPGARTVAENPKTHHFYTCTADLGPAPAATVDNPKPRPSIVPGTFRVLEIGK